jgi:transcriptional regulator with XRE-family HTH domain
VAAARDLAIVHIADRAGVARSHLFAVLKCERSATLSMVQRLADAMEVAPAELLDANRAITETRKSRK